MNLFFKEKKRQPRKQSTYNRTYALFLLSFLSLTFSLLFLSLQTKPDPLPPFISKLCDLCNYFCHFLFDPAHTPPPFCYLNLFCHKKNCVSRFFPLLFLSLNIWDDLFVFFRVKECSCRRWFFWANPHWWGCFNKFHKFNSFWSPPIY